MIFVGSFLGFVGVVAGLIASVYQISGGPPWPTEPEIHLRDMSSAVSWGNISFTVASKSTLFNIKNATFICGLDFVWIEDADRHAIMFEGAAFVLKQKESTPVNFFRGPKDLFYAKAYGSLSLREVLNSPKNAVYFPIKIKKACIWIAIDYKVTGVFPIETDSKIFQWPESLGGHCWLEGPTLKPPPPAGRPFSSPSSNAFYQIPCPAKHRTPYALIESDNKVYLARDKRNNIDRRVWVTTIYDQTEKGKNLQ